MPRSPSATITSALLIVATGQQRLFDHDSGQDTGIGREK
jgi:hypothetical protein